MSKLSQSEIDALFAMHSTGGESMTMDPAGTVELSVPPAPTLSSSPAPTLSPSPDLSPAPAPTPTLSPSPDPDLSHAPAPTLSPAPAPRAAAPLEPERPAVFPTLERVAKVAAPVSPIDLVAAVELDLTVRLGQARHTIREILAMGSGSVLALDNQAGEAVDILVNGRLLARGEVVIVGENFGVRISELVQDPGGQA